jgi:hypothetical protein
MRFVTDPEQCNISRVCALRVLAKLSWAAVYLFLYSPLFSASICSHFLAPSQVCRPSRLYDIALLHFCPDLAVAPSSPEPEFPRRLNSHQQSSCTSQLSHSTLACHELKPHKLNMEVERAAPVSRAHHTDHSLRKQNIPMKVKKTVSVAAIFKQQSQKTKKHLANSKMPSAVFKKTVHKSSDNKARGLESRSSSRTLQQAGRKVSRKRSGVHPLAVEFNSMFRVRQCVEPADDLFYVQT